MEETPDTVPPRTHEAALSPRTQLAVQDLEGAVQRYYAESLASSTKVYSSEQKRFMEFCSLYSIHNVLPVSQYMLCYFVAYLGEKGLGHSTIKTYLAAVRSLQVDYGFDSPFKSSMPKMDRVMKGINVAQGKQK